MAEVGLTGYCGGQYKNKFIFREGKIKLRKVVSVYNTVMISPDLMRTKHDQCIDTPIMIDGLSVISYHCMTSS